MLKARVTEEHKTNYIINDGGHEYTATVRGSFFETNEFPKVGDYVVYETVSEDRKAVIEEVMPRTSTVVRKAVESDDLQVIVANVDIIFVVMGLDNDFNLSRLERYLLLAEQSGVVPVIVLNKCDAVVDPAAFVTQVAQVSGDTPVHAVSAKTGQGMEAVVAHMTSDTTAVLLGSSGAGKSTITNRLLDMDAQEVRSVRSDDSRGRHTTTSRQLFTLPTGGYLIDTPGMRELSLLDSSDEDEDTIFATIEALAQQCQFTNCDHEKSQGCAVLEAVATGVVTERQLQNYLKLQRERLREESKRDDRLSRQEKQRQKNLYRSYKNAQQKKRFDGGL